MPGKSKLKVKAKSRPSGKRKPTAGVKKAESAVKKRKASPKAGAKTKSPPKVTRAEPSASKAKPASGLIEQRIRDLGGWRGQTLARMRALILEADPEMIEECKWVKPTNPSGVPVWSHAGIVCTGEAYTKVVKLTFAQGAKLPDPSRLFNSSLEGNTRRAIDIHEGEQVDANAFKALVKAAVARNGVPADQAPAGPARKPVKPKPKARAAAPKPGASDAKPREGRKGEKVTLLSGGNPQIAKAEGDAPVQAYIAAMPGWKSELGKRLDALIVRTVPEVRKAVKWNSPFYGIEGQGWFLSFHVFTRYLKVTFFRGTSLRPVPPGPSKHEDVRYIDIHENDELDEAQMRRWVKQAAALPGWVP